MPCMNDERHCSISIGFPIMKQQLFPLIPVDCSLYFTSLQAVYIRHISFTRTEIFVGDSPTCIVKQKPSFGCSMYFFCWWVKLKHFLLLRNDKASKLNIHVMQVWTKLIKFEEFIDEESWHWSTQIQISGDGIYLHVMLHLIQFIEWQLI